MRVKLHNIGPIKEADVEFAPLTVLLGPNGSGKTTFTSVTYAVLQAARAALSDAEIALGGPFIDEREHRSESQLVEEVTNEWEESFLERLEFELRRCCSPNLSELARARRGGRNAGPRITVGTPQWSLVFRLDGEEISIERESPDYRRPELDFSHSRTSRAALAQTRKALRGDSPARGVYFPAGRSGLVQTQKALSALMIGALSGGYFEDATIGTIPGTTADFLQQVAQINSRRRSKVGLKLSRLLQKDLLRGRVRIEEHQGSKEMMFRPEGYNEEWPLQYMATSASEMASLVLYLRHNARPTDAILIDEPEAHLHPEGQVLLANFLYQMSLVLSPVIVATHSEYLVSALSNVLLRELGGANERMALAVFEFSFRSQDDRGLGVEVAPLNLEFDQGFEITQFSDVAERVYSESIKLFNDVHASSD